MAVAESCTVYPQYFGLKEPTFSITPDPQYLFLSEQHREALAHLLYGAGESGGFVLLTGEVGTGKTTVCRAFLEQLPDGVDVALILNPAMTVTELLRAVCQEFHIAVPEEERTVKRLVDRINEYLLEAHANGRRPVLMIDEAQNLRPKVLEQIRLLTNLETTKHKLLQIFLVGQPELRTLLQREGLRQLNQRITARYHLRPFHARETAEYVRHRIAVAGVERQLFTPAALRRIHALSGGVPRLINILCDRSLLGACVTRSPLVTKQIVTKAAHEVKDAAAWKKGGAGRTAARTTAVAAALVLALAAGWLTHAWLARMEDPPIPDFLARWFPPSPDLVEPVEPEPEVETEEAEAVVALAGLTEEAPDNPVDLDELTMDRTLAMKVLLRRWGVELGDVGEADPCERVASFGLRCEYDQGGWKGLRFFDRPALLRLQDAEGNDGYAVLGALDKERVTLDQPDGDALLPVSSIDDQWLGEYLVVWQPPPTGHSVIGPGASGESVRWLRKLLSQVPDLSSGNTDSGFFDDGLRDSVRRFQEREGLKIDGIAGPRTLIRLHNIVAMPELPRLISVP
ncbi:MAG: AAA family ATPase [Pseudomonadota bacterium]|nr:AAA family ATPase [Pseudomonadota bacterium]